MVDVYLRSRVHLHWKTKNDVSIRKIKTSHKNTYQSELFMQNFDLGLVGFHFYFVRLFTRTKTTQHKIKQEKLYYNTESRKNEIKFKKYIKLFF